MRRPWITLLGLTAACGSVGTAQESATTPLPTPPPTIAGVGELPVTIPARRALRDEPLVVITRPVNREGVLVELVADRVGGNRLLLVGDSIFAGTARRYGGEMCDGLVPLGWAVAVEAEAGRFVEFGTRVVKRLVPEVDEGSTTQRSEVAADDTDWDAAAVFLGSNYDGDQENFEAEMRTILDRLVPRPTLLYTVTEYRPNWAEVNEVIEALGEEYDNATIIDWEDVARTPGVLMADGLHPGDEGEQVLVELTAAALGRAKPGDGECLGETHRDDSAISDGNGTPNNGGSGDSGGSSRTTAPRSTSPRSTSPSTTSPGSTRPSTTTLPNATTTTSPPTSSPATDPPTTPPTTKASTLPEVPPPVPDPTVPTATNP